MVSSPPERRLISRYDRLDHYAKALFGLQAQWWGRPWHGYGDP